MCGSDVFKEDRGWAAEYAHWKTAWRRWLWTRPAQGENPFPWEPESVKAWVAAIDALAARPEVDAARVGAFGISRGGYSVMQLAGTAPDMVHAVVAVAGHPFRLPHDRRRDGRLCRGAQSPFDLRLRARWRSSILSDVVCSKPRTISSLGWALSVLGNTSTTSRCRF